jgi:hypothetical protein
MRYRNTEHEHGGQMEKTHIKRKQQAPSMTAIIVMRVIEIMLCYVMLCYDLFRGGELHVSVALGEA